MNKISVTFEGLTFEDVRAQALVMFGLDTTIKIDPTPGEIVVPPVPLKKKRRTKAEMEADKAAKAASTDPPPVPSIPAQNIPAVPPIPAAAPVEAAPPVLPNEAPAPGIVPDIDDSMLIQGSSDAARVLGPDPVFAYIKSCGVETVSEIAQEHRLIFLAALTTMVANATPTS